MVVKAALTAKIDRPAGIIRFGGVKKPEEVCLRPFVTTRIADNGVFGTGHSASAARGVIAPA